MVSLNRGYVIGILLGLGLYYAFMLSYRNIWPSIGSITHSYDAKDQLLGQSQTNKPKSLPVMKPEVVKPRRNSISMLSSQNITTLHIKPILPILRTSVLNPEQPKSAKETVMSQPVERKVENRVIPTSVKSMLPTYNFTECLTMKTVYHVAPGSSWGSLPIDLQRTWTKLECDKHIIESDTEHDQEEEEDQQEPELKQHQHQQLELQQKQQDQKPQKKESINPKPKSKSDKQTSAVSQGVGLMKISEDYVEWCQDTKDKYKVQPMKSWGKLPGNMIDMWKSRRCDMVFTVNRMSKRPLSSCLQQPSPSSILSSGSKKSTTNILKNHPNMNQSLPLIAVMAATTTRKVKNPSTNSMALFMYLLPSLIRTLDCGFRYQYVLGYDVGDPFYDSIEGMEATKKWFQKNVEEPMKANAIQVILRPVRVNNSLKKPGPVFLEMARAAYRDGATYFYRINDDTELLNNWPRVFVTALHSFGYPYGVVGPICRQGNQQILTHDFVHRVHMDIFEMNYYPPQLTDWWCDDFISFVYGSKRTLKGLKHPVLHHTGAHGQRYEVDHSAEHLLQKLIDQGRIKIRNYMLKHNVPESVIKQFDESDFNKFTHKYIPDSVYQNIPKDSIPVA